MKYHKILHCLKWGEIGEAPPTELPRLPLKTPTLHIGCVSYYLDLNARDKITKYILHKGKTCRRAKASTGEAAPSSCHANSKWNGKRRPSRELRGAKTPPPPKQQT